MKIRSLSAGFILGVLAATGAGAAFQQKPETAPPAMGVAAGDAAQKAQEDETLKMMKAWTDSMAVREEHKSLAKRAGTYDSTMRMWSMGPDQPPMEFKGTSELKAVLGGRFLQQVDHSQIPLPNPTTGVPEMQPHDGMGFFGYDNYQRMYVGCWVSSSSTQMLTMRGAMSPDGKKLTMYAEMDEPMLGVYGRLIKCVTDYVDDDTQIFSVYDLHAGDNYKAFEIEYKRKE